MTRSPASPAVPPAWSGRLQQRGSRGPTSGQALAAEAGASPYGGRRASRQDSRGFEIKCQRRRSARRKTPDPEEARARRAQGTRPRRTHTLRHRNYRTRAIQLPCFICFTKKQRTLKHEQKIFKDYTKQERSKFEKEMTRTSRNEKNIIIKMKMKTY